MKDLKSKLESGFRVGFVGRVERGIGIVREISLDVCCGLGGDVWKFWKCSEAGMEYRR